MNFSLPGSKLQCAILHLQLYLKAKFPYTLYKIICVAIKNTPNFVCENGALN